MSGEESGAAAKPSFHGKYRLVRNENFESFLEANGANWFIRKMASSASPELEITQDGDKFQFKLHSLFHSRDFGFTLGETFEETMQNGVVMKVTPQLEENKLVMSYVPKDEGQGKPQKHTREITGDELVLTCEVDNITAKRFFKKIE